MNMKLTSLAAAFALVAGMGAVNAEETIDSKEAIQLTANQMDDITAGSYSKYYLSLYQLNTADAQAFAFAGCGYLACSTDAYTNTFAEVVQGQYSAAGSYSSATAYIYY